MKRKVVDAFSQYREELRFFGGTMALLGFQVTAIDIPHKAREFGESNYNFIRALKLAVHAILSGSNRPLYLSAFFGFSLVLASFLLTGYLIYKKIALGVTIEGWTSLMIAVISVGGVNLFCLGVLGLYLGKVFDQTKARPLYIVDTSTDK